MGDRFDPAFSPVPRRRVLVLMGAGALAATGGLGAFLAACTSAPPVTVTLDVDPETLEPGTPTEVPFTMPSGSGTIAATTWMVRSAAGELVAYDPRCTHALCSYRWLEQGARFQCNCHDGQFALDGTVLAGPPPRPLDRFPVRVVDGVVEIDVPGDFESPQGSPAA